MNKKKLIYIIAAVVAAAAITVGIVFLVKSLNGDAVITPTAETAGTLKEQAIEALKTDADDAKVLFEEAKQQYDEIGDTNNSVDMAAQLFLLENK